MRLLPWIGTFVLLAASLAAQSGGSVNTSAVGTVVAVRAEAGSLDLRRDQGPVVTVLFNADTAIPACRAGGERPQAGGNDPRLGHRGG